MFPVRVASYCFSADNSWYKSVSENHLPVSWFWLQSSSNQKCVFLLVPAIECLSFTVLCRMMYEQSLTLFPYSLLKVWKRVLRVSLQMWFLTLQVVWKPFLLWYPAAPITRIHFSHVHSLKSLLCWNFVEFSILCHKDTPVLCLGLGTKSESWC